MTAPTTTHPIIRRICHNSIAFSILYNNITEHTCPVIYLRQNKSDLSEAEKAAQPQPNRNLSINAQGGAGLLIYILTNERLKVKRSFGNPQAIL
jgi:hypothetical protein